MGKTNVYVVHGVIVNNKTLVNIFENKLAKLINRNIKTKCSDCDKESGKSYREHSFERELCEHFGPICEDHLGFIRYDFKEHRDYIFPHPCSLEWIIGAKLFDNTEDENDIFNLDDILSHPNEMWEEIAEKYDLQELKPTTYILSYNF